VGIVHILEDSHVDATSRAATARERTSIAAKYKVRSLAGLLKKWG
jgi:hypothetical protein